MSDMLQLVGSESLITLEEFQAPEIQRHDKLKFIGHKGYLDNLRLPTRIGRRLRPARRCGRVAEGGGLLNR
jgi:hypothetical protein